MKKLLFLLVLTIAISQVSTVTCHAQIQKTLALSKSTLSATDTAFVAYTADDYTKSFTGKLVKVSGTPTGKIYFYGIYPDGVNRTLLDSLTVSTTALQKTFDPGKLIYTSYYLQFITTSATQSLTASATALKRSVSAN